MNSEINKLKLVRLGIDTQYEFVIYMHADCFICKTEGFDAHTQVLVTLNSQSIIAKLNIVRSNILKIDEASLSENAWNYLQAKENDCISLSHISPVTSLKHIRSKIYGNAIDEQHFQEVVTDIVLGKYSNIHLASFITACAGNNLSQSEITGLTKAMVHAGEKLQWDYPLIADKHSVGGLPGNRTTPIVVSIAAAAGLIIPKTSSRAITSPAGTADTVETMTTVNLTVKKIQQVVEKEGGCLAWGGAINLSPADDIIIRVERALDLDPEGQMIASVLSKKAAIGATHVMIDVPVGQSAKVRSTEMFFKLRDNLIHVGKTMGLKVYVLKTDGAQPVGRGVGPALEAKDILAVLNNDKNAPADLKQKAITLTGLLLEFCEKVPSGDGEKLAKKLLENGMALKKFLAICEAQGGFREPGTAANTFDVVSSTAGIISEIDNRNLAVVAKLAGAPHDAVAGIEFFARLGMHVDKGQLLYRIHAETKGELEYSLAYVNATPNIVKII